MSLNMQGRGEAPSSSRYPAQMSELAMRGASEVLDMQMATWRTLLETQARTAAAFGFPDCSDLFRDGDGRMRQVFSSGAEQLLNTAQRTNQAVAEIQRRVGHIVETQAQAAAENWQQGLEQLGAQTDESLRQICETAQQQAERVERATREMSETARGRLRAGGEQLREQVRDGAQRGRETLAQAGEVQRQTGDATNRPGQPVSEEKQKRERGS